MIKFFRHIRKSLLEQNKMGKYFKYAIGEIILVVIGILIALQINNWNENRKLKTGEKVVLNDIIEDLKIDYISFEEQNKLLSSQLQIIDFLIENKTSLDSLNLDLDYFRYSIDIFPITFDENIPEEVYNKEIIEVLKNYYREQQLVLSDHNDYSAVVKELLRPYLRKYNIHNPKSALKNLANNNLKLLNFEQLIKQKNDEYFRQILFELKLKSAELHTSLSNLLVSNKQLAPVIETYINK